MHCAPQMKGIVAFAFDEAMGNSRFAGAGFRSFMPFAIALEHNFNSRYGVHRGEVFGRSWQTRRPLARLINRDFARPIGALANFARRQCERLHLRRHQTRCAGFEFFGELAKQTLPLDESRAANESDRQRQ